MRKELQESCATLRSCHPALIAFKITSSDLVGPDSLQEDTIEIADALQQNNTLQRLHLSFLSHHAVTVILNGIRYHPTLDELTFGNCKLVGELSEILPLNLRRLALNCTTIGAENIARCIKCRHNHGLLLSDVSISWTYIGPNGAKVIGDCLRTVGSGSAAAAL